MDGVDGRGQWTGSMDGVNDGIGEKGVSERRCKEVSEGIGKGISVGIGEEISYEGVSSVVEHGEEGLVPYY